MIIDDIDLNSRIKTHLGIWKLSNWTVEQASIQLNGKLGIYCIENKVNHKLLIGEGKLGGDGSRLVDHINNRTKNNKFQIDLNEFGSQNFQVSWIIEEHLETNRKLIENKLQNFFKNNCYNTQRKPYPGREELLNDKPSFNRIKEGNIITRLNNYTKIQKDYIDECWESNCKSGGKYAQIKYKGRMFLHHVLMYILYQEEIKDISHIIHHKCNNKKCVNPKHLEIITHQENIQKSLLTQSKINAIRDMHLTGKSIPNIAVKLNISQNTVYRYINFIYSSRYIGVSKDTNYDRFLSTIGTNNKIINLGRYKLDIEAAQNRDYYIVKNNLWSMRNATLNFHDIDYYNFTPHNMIGGKVNKYLL